MMKVNPFKPNYPTDPEYFVGREKEIERFRYNIEQGSLYKLDSMAVLGQWGIGKTSMLIKYKDIIQKDFTQVIPITLSITTDLKDFTKFAQTLLDVFQVQLLKYHGFDNKIRGELSNWTLKKLSLLGLEIESEKTSPFLTTGSNLLNFKLREIWDKFLKKSDVRGVVFFLDDLHNLQNEDENVPQVIRDVFQNLVTEGYNYSIIFTARKSYFGEIRELAEPAVRFFDKIVLDPFEENETGEFLNGTMKKSGIDIQFDESTISRIHKLTGGHPYFLSFIGKYSIIYQKSGLIETKRFELLWKSIFKHITEEKFRKDTENLTGNEMNLLTSIAKCDKETVTNKDLKGKFHRQYFTYLLNKNLISRVGWGRYKLYHPLFKEYLRYHEMGKKGNLYDENAV